MTSNDPPSTQVIDLRAIRRKLADLRLDWDAPAFPDVDAARPDLPPIGPLKIEFGHLDSQSEDLSRKPRGPAGTIYGTHQEESR